MELLLRRTTAQRHTPPHSQGVPALSYLPYHAVGTDVVRFSTARGLRWHLSAELSRISTDSRILHVQEFPGAWFVVYRPDSHSGLGPHSMPYGVLISKVSCQAFPEELDRFVARAKELVK